MKNSAYRMCFKYILKIYLPAYIAPHKHSIQGGVFVLLFKRAE